MARQLSTAAERREAVVEAALTAFAAGGLHGTPTTEIARAAGISQAYLFRLFPTKNALYVAAVERCYERIGATFSDAAAQARAAGEPPLEAMGKAFLALLDEDRTVLRSMLQSFAASASGAPEVTAAVCDGYGRLFALVGRLSEAPEEELRGFFADGMLLTVLAGIDAPAVDEPWARALQGDEAAVCEPPPSDADRAAASEAAGGAG